MSYRQAQGLTSQPSQQKFVNSRTCGSNTRSKNQSVVLSQKDSMPIGPQMTKTQSQANKKPEESRRADCVDNAVRSQHQRRP